MGIAPVKIPGPVQICNVLLLNIFFFLVYFQSEHTAFSVLMSSYLLEFSCITEGKFTIMKIKMKIMTIITY